MTENKEALPGHEIQSNEMNHCPGDAKANPRQGAITIFWLAVILVALITLVLVVNQMTKRLAPLAGKPAGAVMIPEQPVVKLADIDDTRIGSSVTISGKVLGLVPPPADSRRPYALTVADDSAEKTINFWQIEYDQIQGKDMLVGAFFRARVSVASYQDKLQLKLASGADLEILDGPPATSGPQTPAQKAAAAYEKETAPAKRDFSRGRLTQAESLPIGAITAAHDGKTVRVRGRVASVRAPAAGTQQPFSLILQEGDASIRVTYWSTVDAVVAVKPAEGAEFEIEGVIEVYKDKPGLKVESGYKMKQIKPAAPAAAVDPAQAVAVSSVTAADRGQIRTVQGTLGAPRALGKGTAFALADDSGTIDLILWDSIIPAEVRGALAEGLRVSAVGEVGEYDGKLQLKANPGTSVQAIP